MDAPSFDVTNFLKHHGVKGMKWGVRRDRGHEGQQASNRKIRKLDKKYENSYRGYSGWVKLQNSFAHHMNPLIEEHNNRPEYKDKNLYENKALYNKYWKEVDGLVDKATKAMTAEIGTNASGTRQLRVHRTGFGTDADWTTTMVDVSAQHSDGLQHDLPNNLSYTCTPVVNNLGQLVSFKCTLNSAMAQSDEVSEFLEHFGIKGMHWGVRRSAEELSRRGVNAGSVTSAAIKLKKDPTKTTIKSKTKAAGGLHKVSDKELNTMLKRMDMEKRYRDMMAEDAKRRQAGLKAAGHILAEVGKVLLPIVATAAASQGVKNYASTGSVFRSARAGARVIEGTARAIGS